MRQSFFLLAFSIGLLLVSCNDDFDINAEWEDITIVYGILDPSDTAHYIRINKAFLGDGDINQMAQESDSIQYQDALSVRLIEYELIPSYEANPYQEESWQRTEKEIAILTRTDEIDKQSENSLGEPGAFSTEDNYLYKTKMELIPGYKYRLEIDIPGKSELVWGDTYIIDDFNSFGRWDDELYKLPMSNELIKTEVEWYSAVYGKLYQTYVMFHYFEITQDYDTSLHSVKINYDREVVEEVRLPSSSDLPDEMAQKIGGVRFYQELSTLIPEKDNLLERGFKSMDVIFLAGGNDLYNYLNISETTTNFGQEPPEYSNINNGVGFFDNRAQLTVYDKLLTNPSLDSLSRGRFTKHLKFSNLIME